MFKQAHIMDIETLINQALTNTGSRSKRELSQRIGISNTVLGLWEKGVRQPTFEGAATLAEAAGLPVIETAATIRLQTSEGLKYRRTLEHMGGKFDLVGRPGLEPGTNGLKVQCSTN